MPPRIDDYHFGRIVVDGVEYRKDLILLPQSVIPDWWRGRGHMLALADLTQVLQACPRVLIVGCGAYGRMIVPPETARAIEAAGIALEAMPTGAAVGRYNSLCDVEATAAALHLTC